MTTARTHLMVALALLGIILLSAGPADAGGNSSDTDGSERAEGVSPESDAKKKRRSNKARPAKRRGRKGKRGHRPPELTAAPLPKPSGDVWLYSENHREEIRVNIYNADGSLNDEALASLDRGFRCRRTGEERAVDPRLYEALSRIQDHFGGERVQLVSGFRYQRNESSRHFHAAAMDIKLDGVSIRELYSFAETLDRGGMGIGLYPRAGFVHIDFRAPGEPSYRWTDRSRPGSPDKGKRPSRRWRKSRKPNS